jgi:hypothetical protein
MEFDLDEDERALMDEINIQQSEPRRVRKPGPSRGFRPIQEETGEDDIDAFVNDTKMENRQAHQAEEWDGGEDPNNEFSQRPNTNSGPSDGYKTIEDEKADLLNKISRLSKKGIQTTARLTIYSAIEDIRAEFKRMSYSIEVEQSIKFQRRMLIACVSGVEFLNKKFDPFDLELDGWSENVMENQEDYDGVFEELFAKYRTKVAVAPEIKFMFMIGGSAMMFHLSKSMFKKFSPVKPKEQREMRGPVGEQREMRGPGIDLSNLGGGMDLSSLLNSLQETRQDDAVSVSDIISIASSGIKEPRKNKKPKKKELIL